ncbi:MAG: hypothetical protein HY347_05750 [candidate division NC10 bacterium]|nr:hypothetical protein [candidate division NC10 bacterium]
MPALDVEKIYNRKEEQEEYTRTLQEAKAWKEIAEALEALMEQLRFPLKRAVPNWIQKWAEELEKAGVRLKGGIEEARRISRKFKTPLSEEIIAEREERR